jgi:hypothetical protein
VNATENTESGASTQERPRCRAGYRQKNQCWREATERLFPDSLDPEVCAEHFRAIQLSNEASEMLGGLESVQEWIASHVDGPVETTLQPRAWEMRAAMEEQYWRLHLAARTAERMAFLGPEESERISPEASREFTELFERSHAVEAAIAILEDAPGDVFGAIDRWQIVGGLAAVRDALNEEVSRCKERIGLKTFRGSPAPANREEKE